jgi:hypothetical protein
MSGSFHTGPPREADQGGKGGFFFHWSLVTTVPTFDFTIGGNPLIKLR